MPQYAPGYNIAATWNPQGGGTNNICIVSWDWEESVTDLDTSSSCSGGIEERIAGLGRGRGSVGFNYDLAAYFTSDPPRIRAGVKGIFRLYVAANRNPYQIPVLILSVPVKAAVAGKVEVVVNVGLSSDVGAYLYPS